MDHTLRVIDDELSALTRQVSELAAKTEDLLRRALLAGLEGHDELVDGVVRDDDDIDALTSQLERASIRLLALRQPRADDLRKPVAAMKIAMNLERCGDLAKNIAKRGRLMWRMKPEGLDLEPIRRMGGLVSASLSRLRAAYGADDVASVLGVWHGDAEIDALYEEVSSQLMAMMTVHPEAVEAGMHLLFMAKNLERIGDHATNIAELIHYEMLGAGPVGNRPKLDPLDVRL